MKEDLNKIVIAPFRAGDQDETRNLILQGLGEHWGFIDCTKNPDLDDIATTYANATFLVARLGERIVGFGAFFTPASGVAQIVRMSVAKDYRRCGIGTLILQELCERAKAAGYPQVILTTTDTWNDAIQFYKKFGFQITHYVEGGVYMVMNLGA